MVLEDNLFEILACLFIGLILKFYFFVDGSETSKFCYYCLQLDFGVLNLGYLQFDCCFLILILNE